MNITLPLSLILLVPAGAGAGPGPVDWANQAYTVDDRSITLKNGTWQDGDAEADSRESLDLTGVHAVDLDRDGQPEYAIGLNYWGGGTGRFDSLYIYRIAGGSPLMAGRIPGGDRGDGGHAAVRTDGAAVVLERNVTLPWEGVCCPSLSLVEYWVWVAGEMQQDIERSGVIPLAVGDGESDYAAELKAARAAMGSATRNEQQAVDHLLRALQASPGDTVALGELGFAMMSAKVGEAEAVLWAAARSKGSEAARAAAFYNLGKLYLGRGDGLRAVDAAQRSLVLRPGNGPTEKLLAEARVKAAAKPAKP